MHGSCSSEVSKKISWNPTASRATLGGGKNSKHLSSTVDKLRNVGSSLELSFAPFGKCEAIRLMKRTPLSEKEEPAENAKSWKSLVAMTRNATIKSRHW